MRQSMAQFTMARYRLQPGDGTAYEFIIVPLTIMGWSRSCNVNHPLPGGAFAPNLDTEVQHVVKGVHPNYDRFVTLIVCSPGQGVYEVRKSSLRRPHRPFVDYLQGHMPGVETYTVAAVVMAAMVLVDEPDHLEEAAEAMLRAPALLHDTLEEEVV